MEKLYKLFRLHCADLLVLEEMEWNGVLYAREEAIKYAHELQTKIDSLVRTFSDLVGESSVSISSGKHISAVLYGGTIIEEFRMAVGFYKSGAKKGETRYKIERLNHVFERLVEPLAKTETALSTKRDDPLVKEWSVGEDVLKQLKAKGKARQIIDCVLEYRRLEKLRGTYLQGYADLIDKMNWEGDMIHGGLNQCVAITGRLSSTSP